QVRRRRLPPRTRRPLGDPDVGGAADVARARRDHRRDRPAAAHDRVLGLLPTRGGVGGARHARAPARARLRQGRAGRLLHARAGASFGAVTLALTPAQTTFVIALLVVIGLVTFFALYVASSTLWADRWMGRRR